MNAMEKIDDMIEKIFIDNEYLIDEITEDKDADYALSYYLKFINYYCDVKSIRSRDLMKEQWEVVKRYPELKKILPSPDKIINIVEQA